MEQVEDRDTGDNAKSDMEMILIDKMRKKRIRKIASFSRDKGEDDLRLLFFLAPANVKNTGFLTYSYDAPGKDDDQWLYMPALKKTKRIASSEKTNSFMGSDFTYSDMSSRELEDYYFTFHKKTKEVDIAGHPAWVIQALPRGKEVIDETGYTKSLLFVRKDNLFIIRGIFWLEDGGYMKYMDVKSLEQIDGIWVGTEMHMTKKKGKKTFHKTILKLNNVKFNQKLAEDLFTVRTLEKGL